MLPSCAFQKAGARAPPNQDGPESGVRGGSRCSFLPSRYAQLVCASKLPWSQWQHAVKIQTISKRPVLFGTFLSEAYPVKTTRLVSLDSGSSPPVLETETKASEKPHKTHTQDLAVGGGFLLAQVRGDSPLHHAVSHWGSNCCPPASRADFQYRR